MCDGKLEPVTESIGKLQIDNTSTMVSYRLLVQVCW